MTTKVRKNLTLNLGLRWDYFGVPYSPEGLTAAAIGGGGAAFGISGRDFTGWMNPGARGDQTVFQFVGQNSPNSGQHPYNQEWLSIGPAVGFAYQAPWFGEGKTTLRGGYQITYQGGSRFNTLEGPLTQPPGRVYAGTYTGTITQPYISLASVSAANVPTPLPAGIAPMTPIPITDRSQGVNFFDPNYTNPYVQNLVLSMTTASHRMSPWTCATLELWRASCIRVSTSTPITSSTTDWRQSSTASGKGTDVTPTLDRMLAGINLCQSGCTGGQTYGAIGSIVSGVAQTAAYQLRSNATFQTNLAAGLWSAVAGSLNTLNYTQAANCSSLTDPTARAAGNCNLPTFNSSTTRGAVLRANGFPENFIATNPQFTTANYLSNMGNTNYHSMQAEVTLRPTHGFGGSSTTRSARTSVCQALSRILPIGMRITRSSTTITRTSCDRTPISTCRSVLES
jgi:hypothetical protein